MVHQQRKATTCIISQYHRPRQTSYTAKFSPISIVFPPNFLRRFSIFAFCSTAFPPCDVHRHLKRQLTSVSRRWRDIILKFGPSSNWLQLGANHLSRCIWPEAPQLPSTSKCLARSRAMPLSMHHLISLVRLMAGVALSFETIFQRLSWWNCC